MSDSGPGNREVAYRVFAAEFEDATVSFKQSDEERAPNYVISPTGGRLNRVFSVGVFTEKAEVGGGQVRARINDLTGTLVTYAGQYQPGPQAFLENTDPPAFLALTGKARTFEPEDGDRIYSSVRPESVNAVDAATRDRWVVRTAERTVARVGSMAAARQSGLQGEQLHEALVEAGLTDSLAAGTAIAVEEYAPTGEYLQTLRTCAVQAAEVVAGDRDEVDRFDLRPTEGEDAPAILAELATLDLPEATVTGTEAEPEPTEAEVGGGGSTGGAPASAETGVEDSEAVEPEAAESGAPEPEPTETGTAEPAAEAAASGPVTEPETGSEADTEPEPATEFEPESESVVESGPDVEAEEEPAPETEAEAEPELETEPESEELDDDIEDFEPGEFDLDEAEREEVEERFGTEFETASEFDPDETTAEPDTEPEAEPEVEASEPETEETDAEPDADEPAGDVELGDVVVEVIQDLDGGDGASHGAVVKALVDRYGADADAAADAIEGAMMNGECYEPSDGQLKAI